MHVFRNVHKCEVGLAYLVRYDDCPNKVGSNEVWLGKYAGGTA